MAAFDRQLFEALKPPVGEMEIKEFTGSQKGDKVHIQSRLVCGCGRETPVATGNLGPPSYCRTSRRSEFYDN